jgi:DNA-binding XRE family transcriptional regulator
MQMTTAREIMESRPRRKASDEPDTLLYRLRCQYRLSLREVGTAVDAAPSTIQRIERGDTTKCSVDLALRLARFYETTVEEVFGEDDGVDQA